MIDTEEGNEAAQRIRTETDPEATAAALLRSVRTPFEVAAKLLHHPDEDVRVVSSLFLGQMEELGLGAIMSAQGLSATDRAWALRTVVHQETLLRADVVAWMGPLLRDRTPLSPDQPPRTALRICDEALLSVRRIIDFDEAVLGASFDEQKFKQASVIERDGLIAVALKSPTLRRAAGDDDDEV